MTADTLMFIKSSKKAIATLSSLFAAGLYGFWQLNSPEDWFMFFFTLIFSAVALGAMLGYRWQRLDGVQPWAVAYPVSWRLAMIRFSGRFR